MSDEELEESLESFDEELNLEPSDHVKNLQFDPRLDWEELRSLLALMPNIRRLSVSVVDEEDADDDEDYDFCSSSETTHRDQ